MKDKKYIFTPEMDEEIRKCYQERVDIRATAYAGPVKALAEKMGIPRWRVASRACQLEVLPVQKKEPPWSDTELWILKNCAHRSFERIQVYLKRAGYHRTLMGIRLKKKRMKLSRSTMNGYTAHSLAKCFGIDEHTVIDWIRKDWLTADRRGTARTSQQGGDEYFIRPEWIREFIMENVEVIDFRKLDKYWLVEMLTKIQGSEVTHIPERADPTEEYGVDPEVTDLFDEAQGRA